LGIQFCRSDTVLATLKADNQDQQENRVLIGNVLLGCAIFLFGNLCAILQRSDKSHA
jgi:hypothetical protein